MFVRSSATAYTTSELELYQMYSKQDHLPATGREGFVRHWRDDLVAGFSVSLVALPLSLGIGMASGAQPMAGLISAIVGGLVTTFFRGGHVAINGPAAGLIAVILGAIVSMEDGSGRGINYMLAAVVVSGSIQVLLGLLRLGKLAKVFPSMVINGMLAAIGIIILARQLHVALGTTSDAQNILVVLLDVLRQLPDLHPYPALIALTAILVLVLHGRIKSTVIRLLPAPVWVLITTIPLVYVFRFLEPHEVVFLDKVYHLGPELLIQIPDNPMDALLWPDFSQIHTANFWLAVLSITLIAALEILAIARAVDKLDPYQRVSDPNKDLIGNGLATLVCGCIGGLPVIPVIARSSVNIQNQAKTRWSNFYYGLVLLLFVALLAPLLQKIPLATLAAILVYTGYQLAAPKVFRHSWRMGWEQLLFFVGTILITLYSDLLWGIFSGITITLLLHLLRARLPVSQFFSLALRSKPQLKKNTSETYRLLIRGIANFLSLLSIEQQLSQIPAGSTVEIDLSETRLVDLSVQERLRDFVKRHNERGGTAVITGLQDHKASSLHPLALKTNMNHPI